MKMLDAQGHVLTAVMMNQGRQMEKIASVEFLVGYMAAYGLGG